MEQPRLGAMDRALPPPIIVEASRPARGLASILAHQLVRRPMASLGLSVLVAAVLFGGAVGIASATNRLPNFQQAQVGFEPKNTHLSGVAFAHTRGLEQMQCSGTLSGLPDGNRTYFRWARYPDPEYLEHTKYCQPVGADGKVESAGSEMTRSREQIQADELAVDGSPICSERPHLADMHSWRLKLVFKPESDNIDLFSTASIHGMCELDEAIRAIPHFQDNCGQLRGESSGMGPGPCCASRSLGNVIARLSHRGSCKEVRQMDIDAVRRRLARCASRRPSISHADGMYKDDVSHATLVVYNNSRTVASSFDVDECDEANSVREILYVLVDSQYDALATPGEAGSRPSYVQMMLPSSHRTETSKWLVDVHINFLEGQVGRSFGGARLVAYEANIKFRLFTHYLMQIDLPLVGTGATLLILMIWLYSGSGFFTCFAFLQIVLAFGLAYFLYTAVLRLPFFPFLNLTGLFICVGIGADDIFVFIEAFESAVRSQANEPLEAQVESAIRGAGGATLVTSMTTAGAFFATAVSSITSIKCFGVFCGLVVLCDWILMITFVPALILVYRVHVHGGCGSCCECCPHQPIGDTKPHLRRRSIGPRFGGCFQSIVTHSWLRYVWLLLSVCTSVGVLLASIDESGTPRLLAFPHSQDLQMLSDSSPFEQYCCVGVVARDKFNMDESKSAPRLTARMVWGVNPVDHSNSFDPYDWPRPPLVAVNFTAYTSQRFLLHVCNQAREAAWFDNSSRDSFRCTIETLINQASIPCDHANSLHAPCCGLSADAFPFPPFVYETCLKAISLRRGGGVDENDGLLYDLDGTPRALWMGFPTNRQVSSTFAISHDSWRMVSEWAEFVLSDAPALLPGGWVNIELDWYALQVGTRDSAISSTVVAGILAGCVILGLTLNWVVALYTTTAISLIIATVTGSLGLLGWNLSIIESVIFACAVGMACDFVAHLGYAYRKASGVTERDTRQDRVAVALDAMIRPITAAAISTALMGMFLSFSATKFMAQYGIFIVLLQVPLQLESGDVVGAW